MSIQLAMARVLTNTVSIINFNTVLNFNIKNRWTSYIQISIQLLKQLKYITILANIFKPSAFPC
jgi:uncharacterized membrane protein